MIRDFTIHGLIGDRIEYFAMVVGRNLARELYSFELGGDNDPFHARFFSRGNELALRSDGVTFRGNGGSFCEYMFGVDLPIEDLTRSDVYNRLVIHGALEDRGEGGLKFTARTEGRESYDSLFLNGNAVANYLFFVAAGDPNLSVLDVQREVLRRSGKKIKHHNLSGDLNNVLRDTTHQMMEWLSDLDPTLFVVQLVHSVHREYYNECREAFARDHDLTGPVEVELVARAQDLGIDQYTRERIKIDMVYKEPENRLLIDEYKRLLIEASNLDVVSPELVAQLARLRTLSLRRQIPEVILKKLDHKFPISVTTETAAQKSDYLSGARSVLEGLFLVAGANGALDKGDLDALIRAKHLAALTREMGFEELLLETGRRIDEAAERGEGSPQALEQFSKIVTYFDRYDACSEAINHLAFIGESKLNQERIRSLRNHREAFDEVSLTLFDDCFFDPLYQNKYLSGYGRKKVDALKAGIQELLHGEAGYKDVCERIDQIAAEEKHYNLLVAYFRNNMRLAYLYQTGEAVETIHEKVNADLFVQGLIKEAIPRGILDTALQHVLEEELYLSEVLPDIIGKNSPDLRIDFIQNSGLDLFRVEELEKEYLERHRLPDETLPPIDSLPLAERRRA